MILHFFARLMALLLLLTVSASAPAQSPLYFPPTTGTTWATTSPQSLGWCQTPLDTVLNYLGSKRTKAFIILKDGRMVVEQYYGTFTRDSAWYWASAGKTLTAVLTGVAQQEGLLSLNDSVSRFLGRGWTTAPPAKERLITIRHQLTMTSGLNDNLPPTPQVPDPDNCLLPTCLPYRADAGTRWAYHNAPYRLIQNVVVRASNQTFQQFTQSRIGTPIGMSGRWIDYTYYSRARDMARFGLLMLSRGTWNGTAVLRDTAFFRQMTTPSQPLNRSYGYLWWLNGQSSFMLPGPQQLVYPGSFLPNAPRDLIAALGKNDQKIYVVPSLGLVVVRLGESAGVQRQAVSSFDAELWTRLMAMFNCRPSAARASANLTISVYPVPATDELTVELPHTSAAAMLRLTDAVGRPVATAVAQPLTHMLVRSLAPGLYFLQILDYSGQLLTTRRVLR